MDRETIARAMWEAREQTMPAGTRMKFDAGSIPAKSCIWVMADAALSAIEQAGFVIVPKEPTEAMVDRFVSRALQVSIHGEGGWSNYARNQYEAMLAGAAQ